MTATIGARSHLQPDASRVRVGYLAYGLDRPLSGIGRYVVELGRELVRHGDDVDLRLIKPFTTPAAGLDEIANAHAIRGSRLPAFMSIGPPQIARVAQRIGATVVHDPFGVSPFLIPRRIAPFARIVTLHDVIPFIYPETHARLTNLLFRSYIPRTLRYVDTIVTVSEASKRDIVKHLRVDPSRVKVIMNGVAERFSPAPRSDVQRAVGRYGIEGPYILTVGAIQARKNLETLFTAYRAIRDAGYSHPLVVIGKEAWKTAGAFARLAELGLEGSVHFTGYVPEGDLPPLYSGASVFVFPSLYEGFGLPPLEAMACGAATITSNASSLPEVVGEAGIMVDPLDDVAMMREISRVLDDDELRGWLGQRGIERAREFTWQRSADAHLRLYQSFDSLALRPATTSVRS